MDTNKNNSEVHSCPNTVDWIDSNIGNHLSPIKHPQRDFFIADIFDAISIQLDMASMEFPLFALKAGDKKIREYCQGDFRIELVPSVKYGRATIHDKDIWIYCISKLMQALRDGEEINRTVHFTIYDYLKITNRHICGATYERTKDSLDRLSGTRITTNIETDKIKEARGFGLIDAWRIVEEKDGRMIRVSVTLPEWLYRSIASKSVLTINPDYFRLRKPLDRRIYELARKHCGNNQSWKFNLSTLHQRSGSTASMKEFRKAIKSLAESNQLPDYCVEFDGKKNQVTFIKRVCLKDLTEEIKAEAKENKPKRKRITEYEAGQLARPGEEWPDLLQRIGSEYHVIFNNKEMNE
ncbi:RepB family plasmid replication initiator protein [Wohlfahrtiimonas chitiniclastica]|uniref:replication initiator protein A n=1 Tax=Wohlfahrtiimonas chitiniclastica TaxID=400946 RepID=UPI000B984AFF|nr:replication initiator protein A [Wohlfahrtiimonas chitiniclastica]OYQ77515.1 RepB family plasmid replication initiator protein [Wohlfahrtiimonas chitiniclastica]